LQYENRVYKYVVISGARRRTMASKLFGLVVVLQAGTSVLLNLFGEGGRP